MEGMIRMQTWSKEYTYLDCERLGDALVDVNCNQAFLCLENAEFLATDADEKNRLAQKKRMIYENYSISVKPASIVIVSYNCAYMMQKCIESIREHCAPGAYEVVVVENASTDGIREWLIAQEDLKVILLDVNSGFPIGCNIGVQYSEKDNDIFLLNNDTRMSKNALFWLRMGLYEKADVGACGCIANYCGNGQDVDIQFTLPNEYLEYARGINVYMENPYEERNRLCGFAMLIKRQVWDQIDGMDEAYTPGYLDDDDISMQIRHLGYRMVICHNSYIYHAGSQNFANLPNLEEIVTKNYHYLVNKWGFDIPAASRIDVEAIEKICADNRSDFRVLEIGCGCGATLARIKYLHPKAEVVGIELNKLKLEVAPKDFDSFLENEIEEKLQPGYFDYIIYRDEKNLKNGYGEKSFYKYLLKATGRFI